jgi:hypothetical protein
LGASSKATVEPAKGHIDLSSYSDGITLEFWFQPATPIVDTTSGTPRPGGSTHQPIANFSTKDGNDLILCLDDKDFFFLDGIETNTLSARAYPPIKTWYHVALIYNRRGRDLKLLVDGVLQATFKLDKELVALASFGARISKDKTIASEWLTGSLDEIRLWSMPLDPTYVSAFRKQRSSGLHKRLIGCWRCDEGHGDILFDLTGN